MITLSRIETEISEKNFAEKILTKTGDKKEYKTFFLNGAWGTGKTEYLIRTEKKLNKGKFIQLRFWEQTDERSVVTIAFAKIHPIMYWLIKLLVVFAATISILMTPAINLGLESLIGDLWVKLFGSIALFVAIWHFFKYKSDDFYSYCLKKLPSKSFRQKIIVLDDFDRIKEEKQEKLYQFFNIIKGKMPIIFVGDFEKISHSKNAYLRKIIDERVDLPILINPTKIWEEYFKQLSIDFKNEVSRTFLLLFKQLFIDESRTLRDRNQFNQLVNQEFYEHQKKGRVQAEQQLVIIYVSWFYPELLQVLREGKKLVFSKDYGNTYNNRKYDGALTILYQYKGEKTINDIIMSLLEDNNKYPKSFDKNREAYFLYESISNLSDEDGDKILKNKGRLEEELSKEVINYDFFLYLQYHYNETDVDIKNNLLNIALKEIKDFRRNPITNFIIQEKRKEIMGDFFTFNDGKIEINRWDAILEKNEFALFQKLYFFISQFNTGFGMLSQKYSNLSLTSKDYTEATKKDQYFLTYLTQNNIFNNFSDWDDEVQKSLNNLLDEQLDEQYLSILTTTGLLKNVVDKEYKLYTIQFYEDSDNTYKKQNNHDIIKNYFDTGLVRLIRKGYSFKHVEQKNLF